MSSNDNQQNQKPTEVPKEAQPKEDEKKAEGAGSKSEYKGNNPGSPGWKDKRKA